MNTSENQVMTMRGRLYIYATLAAIITTYNLVFELQFTTPDEAIWETIVLYPMVFFFIFVTYWIRKQVVNRPFAQHLFKNNRLYYNSLIIGMIILKTTLQTFLSRWITYVAFIDFSPLPFFDWIFFAILLCILVLTVFVYFFEDYIETVENQHQMSMEISRYEAEKMILKYQSLKKQLNPHFLFNSFNSLISLIPVDPRKAEKFVEELSNIYRYTLSQCDELVVKLSDELQMIHSYVHLQKIRFGEALIYKEDLGQLSEQALVPPMTLQLLVENAIKHNKINKNSPLEISVGLQNGSVFVKNNIRLKDQNSSMTTSFGIGLKSLKSQLEVVTDQPIRIEEDDATFSVFVPLIKSELDD